MNEDEVRAIAREEAREAVASLCGLVIQSLKDGKSFTGVPSLDTVARQEALIGAFAQGLNDYGKGDLPHTDEPATKEESSA